MTALVADRAVSDGWALAVIDTDKNGARTDLFGILPTGRIQKFCIAEVVVDLSQCCRIREMHVSYIEIHSCSKVVSVHDKALSL